MAKRNVLVALIILDVQINNLFVSSLPRCIKFKSMNNIEVYVKHTHNKQEKNIYEKKSCQKAAHILCLGLPWL